MNSQLRTIVVLAGVAVLAATSQATITFTALSSDMTTLNNPPNQISAIPPHLSNAVFGLGTVTDMGSATVTSTTGISELAVNQVEGLAYNGGTVSLLVTIYDGTSTTDPVLATLYNEGPGTNLMPHNQNNLVSIAPGVTDLITFSATYKGTSASSLGYLGAFSIEAVPEPSAVAALGVGVIGLCIRRRRSGK